MRASVTPSQIDDNLNLSSSQSESSAKDESLLTSMDEKKASI
jgi:hypothetical protein